MYLNLNPIFLNFQLKMKLNNFHYIKSDMSYYYQGKGVEFLWVIIIK